MQTGYSTTNGIKKAQNQDALIIKKGRTEIGEILFMAVCDGMGGLSSAELASTETVNLISDWFDIAIEDLVKLGITDQEIISSLTPVIEEANTRLYRYGEENSIQCGTTISGVLLYNNRYATVNVGDSRIYKLTNIKIEQLTHDQTLVQQLIDEGEITPEEAETHKKRSTLTQCIGVSDDVFPVFTFGSYQDGDVFLACSDGFRHKLKEDEIFKLYSPQEMPKIDQDRIDFGITCNTARQETDNISVVICKT